MEKEKRSTSRKQGRINLFLLHNPFIVLIDNQPVGNDEISGGTYITAGKKCTKCGDKISGGWGTNPGAM